MFIVSLKNDSKSPKFKVNINITKSCESTPNIRNTEVKHTDKYSNIFDPVLNNAKQDHLNLNTRRSPIFTNASQQCDDFSNESETSYPSPKKSEYTEFEEEDKTKDPEVLNPRY